MDKNTLSKLDELKLVYYEILNGYTFDFESSLYIKHFSEKESHLLLVKKMELQTYYEKNEVPSEAELLKNAMATGEWTQEKEDKILELKYRLSDNEKNLHNIIPEQRPWIESQLELARKELQLIYTERKMTLGRSVQDLVDEDVNDYVCYISCFKDKELTIPLQDTYENYQDWEPLELNKVSVAFSRVYNKFSEENIKQIASMPFFLNKFRYSKDDFYGFLGIPLSKISHNQIHLMSLGSKNINTLNHCENEPPDINLEATIPQVAHWYEMQYSIQLAKQKQSK